MEDENGRGVTLQHTYSEGIVLLLTKAGNCILNGQNYDMAFFYLWCSCNIETARRDIKVWAIVTAPTRWIQTQLCAGKQ